MIFGLSDGASTALIVGAFGAFNAIVVTAGAIILKRIDARGERNTEHLVRLEQHTDGMQATIERLAEAKGVLTGGAQVRSDMQAGADSPLVLPTVAPPQQVEIVNPKPVPVVVSKDKPADK